MNEFKPGDRVRFRDGASTHVGTVRSAIGREIMVLADPVPERFFRRRPSNIELIDEKKPVATAAKLAGHVA